MNTNQETYEIVSKAKHSYRRLPPLLEKTQSAYQAGKNIKAQLRGLRLGV